MEPPPALARLLPTAHRLLTALRHARQTRAAQRAMRELPGRVQQGRDALATFDDCSGRDFSALADALSGFDTRVGEIAEQAAALDRLLRDQDEDRAHHSAFELFKKAIDLAHSSIGIALTQEEEMAQLEGTLLQNRGQFTQNSIMFRVLVLNVRAESARPEIDAEHRGVFASVADEMETMGRQMKATVDSAFGELESIVTDATVGREQLTHLEKQLSTAANTSILQLRAELDQLKKSLAPCVEANRVITTLLGQARARTGDLITALQYQDIVRQQLEHVGQGFDDLVQHAANARGLVPDFAYLGRAARVQQAHLRAARQAIEDSGRSLTDGGQALLVAGTELATRYTAMERLAATVHARSKLGTMIQAETDQLVGIAGESERTNERIARLLDRIEASVKIFSTEISRHEFEVKLVALNAQIAAYRVPEAFALNKLTEEIARVSAGTAELTAAMTRQLAETLTRLQKLRREAEEVRRTIGQEKTDLTGGAQHVAEKLARLNQRLTEGSTTATTLFKAAYGEVRDTLGALQFPHEIPAAFAPAEELCTQLVGATAVFTTGELTAEGSQLLDAHRSRYTMRGERDSEAAALATPAKAAVPGNSEIDLFAEPAASLPAAPVAAPADDGVELF